MMDEGGTIHNKLREGGFGCKKGAMRCRKIDNDRRMCRKGSDAETSAANALVVTNGNEILSSP